MKASTEHNDIRPIFVSPEVGSEMVSIARTSFYALLKTGEIKSVKVGKRRLVSVASLEEWAASKLADS